MSATTPVNPLRTPPHSSRAARWACVGALLLASLYVLAAGAFRAARPGVPLIDLSYFIVAGQLWLEGRDPYDAAAFAERHAHIVGFQTGEAMHNPPQFVPFTILMAALPYDAAKLVLATLNTLAAFALAALTAAMARALLPPRPPRGLIATVTLLPAFILLLNGTYRQIVLGQVTLLVTVALIAGWLLAHRGRPVVGGVLLGLSTVKPQYALLPLLWLLLDRRWTAVAAALATALLLGLPVFLSTGPWAAIHGWLDGVRHYDTMPYNALGYGMVMGVPSALASLGVPMPTAPTLTLLAVLALAVARLTLPRMHPVATLGLLLGIQMILTYGKYIEVPLLAPFFAVLWWRHGHDWRRVALGFLLLFPLVVPERFYIATGHFDQVGHLRMIPLLLAAAVFLPAALQTHETTPAEGVLNENDAGRTPMLR